MGDLQDNKHLVDFLQAKIESLKSSEGVSSAEMMMIVEYYMRSKLLENGKKVPSNKNEMLKYLFMGMYVYDIIDK